MIERRLAAGLLAACAAVILTGRPAPVAADCDGPYPSFVEAAPSARQVVIGDVIAVEGTDWVAAEGRTSRFVLRAWSLDGQGPAELPVRDVTSQPCAGYLFAGVGDRVAIAFDGRAFSTKVPVNAIAWIEGGSPEVIGIETLTIAEVFRSVGREAPEVFPPVEAPATESGVPWLPVAIVVTALIVAPSVLRRLLA